MCASKTYQLLYVSVNQKLNIHRYYKKKIREGIDLSDISCTYFVF